MLWVKMKDSGARKVLVHTPVQFILDYTIPISSVPAADGNAWQPNKAAAFPIIFAWASFYLNGNFQTDSDTSLFESTAFRISLLSLLPGMALAYYIKYKMDVSNHLKYLTIIYTIFSFIMSIFWI